ncbi:uroplakin-3b-like [Hyperolius riggenbachi]|uniref:uroplakin-3b-like n=1 Tax=Hyperolius riggenbachi TaxID=752182 RepID=UPI0035A30563
MDLHVKVGLLLVLCASVSTQDVLDYKPKLISNGTLINNIGYRTFVLEQPNCTFNQFNTTNVYLVVAQREAVNNITDSALGGLVKYDSFPTNHYYHTLPLPAMNYPCSSGASGFINALQVGSEINCTSDQYCNSPLNNSDIYRVKFVLLNSTGIFKCTNWSDDIVLLKPSEFLDVSSDGRSDGRVVLTMILSVLLGILLLCTIAALAIGSRDICWKQSIGLGIYSDTYDSGGNLTGGTYRTHYSTQFPVSPFPEKLPAYEAI